MQRRMSAREEDPVVPPVVPPVEFVMDDMELRRSGGSAGGAARSFYSATHPHNKNPPRRSSDRLVATNFVVRQPSPGTPRNTPGMKMATFKRPQTVGGDRPSTYAPEQRGDVAGHHSQWFSRPSSIPRKARSAHRPPPAPPRTPKYALDQAGWRENSVRMGEAHGHRPPPIERYRLPRELVDDGQDAWEGHPSRPVSKGKGGHTQHGDGAISDGYSWAREWGDEAHSSVENPPQAPTLSHLWWEDVVFPKLFPRNQPGGTEWKTLRMHLTNTLQAATEGDEATAEEALDTVFRTAFHEIYRRLPLFKGAVVKSEREFARVQTKLNEIHAVKEAEKQLLKDELISTHTALQAWRIRALRSESEVERMNGEEAAKAGELDRFKDQVVSQFEALKADHEQLQLKLQQHQEEEQSTKMRHLREQQLAVERALHESHLANNDALLSARAAYLELETDLRAKIVAAEHSSGAQLLENGKLSNKIKGLNKVIERLQKLLKEHEIALPLK